ncbi:MAG: hypothetical protein K2P52_08430 [Campylobacterales bacterium]|nr:hypothetical protein [Campylobacterales bacterium]
MNYKALSDKEIEKLLGNEVNIVTYSELYKYGTIDQLLGRYKRCIILFCYKENYGHWVTVFICPTTGKLHFFNSYGDMRKKFDGYPDNFLQLINKKYRVESHQDYPYLSDLLYKSPYELEYNPTQFQQLDKRIKTCGYWCVLRLMCQEMTDEQFENFIKENCQYNKISSDNLAVELVLNN